MADGASGASQPQGWYGDPWGAEALRWWDWQTWTGHTVQPSETCSISTGSRGKSSSAAGDASDIQFVTGHPDNQPSIAFVTVQGGARWSSLRQRGGNGLVGLQVFDWGVQIGPPERSVLARLYPPTPLEWADIDSVEYHPRWSPLKFNGRREASVTFDRGASLEAVLGILRGRGLIRG